MLFYVMIQQSVLAARNTLMLEHVWFDLSERHEFERRPIDGLTYFDFTGQKEDQDEDPCISKNMLISCLISPETTGGFIEHYIDDFIIADKSTWSHGIGVGLAWDQSPAEPIGIDRQPFNTRNSLTTTTIHVPQKVAYSKLAQLTATDACDIIHLGLRPVLVAYKEISEVFD